MPKLCGPLAHKDTILVVDDNPDSLRFLVDTLDAEGMTVLIARSGEATLELLGETLPDLILMDAVMPGMSGVELFARVHEVRPDMRVLYMSGYTNEAALRRGVIEPGRSLIHKPFALATLAQRVRQELDLRKSG